MGRIRQVVGAVILLLAVTCARADAITIHDIIELSKAGVSDDVLLALIEVDRSVFSIDSATLKTLKQSGVSDPVIIAIIRSGRTPVAEPAPQVETAPPTTPVPTTDPSPQPQVIVIDHHDPIEVPVAVPVAVPVFVTAPRRHVPVDRAISVPVGNDLSPRPDLIARPPNAARPLNSVDHPTCTTPVFWGFGGKLRPGSWEPPAVCR